MSYRILGEGFVSRRQPGTPTSAALGPRSALTRDGEIICVFGVQSDLGKNDFRPLLARSRDGGTTWTEAVPIWPDSYHQKFSVCSSISATADGDLLLFGFRIPVGVLGEPYWSDETHGLKQNELVWSRSRDNGVTWDLPMVIPMPIPGSAESPCAMFLTSRGTLICCYSPYNTFDPNLKVEKNQVIFMASDDDGRTWRHNAMLRFANTESLGAEAWVVELADQRLLGAGWHIQGDVDPMNPYALSSDGGVTWTPTLSTGIRGQSIALTPLPDGRVLMVYNQRKHGPVGVWLAVANPTPKDFGIQHNEQVWKAEISSQKPTAKGADDMQAWTSFAFGEPSALLLRDGTVLVTLWCQQPSGYGIRYVKLALS